MTTTPISLVFLGTGSAQPSKTRNHSCIALNFPNETWLFDCGEGTQHQILACPHVKISRIRRIFITHLHGDHCFGLPGLLCTCAGSSQDEEREGLVEIVGPPGTRAYVRHCLSMSQALLGNLKYVVHELHIDPPNTLSDSTLHYNEIPGRNMLPSSKQTWSLLFDTPTHHQSGSRLWTIQACPIQHRGVPCVGYVLVEPVTPGQLQPDKVMPLIQQHYTELVHQLQGKNPKSLLSRLNSPSGYIDFPDGTRITANQVRGPDRPGRKIVLLGDTCNPYSLQELAMDADVLVHEATNACLSPQDGTPESVQASTIEKGHSTPTMAGLFAKAIRAKSLILTHFSVRYSGDQQDSEAVKVMQQIKELAVEAFESSQVVTAYDFYCHVIPRKS